MIHNDAVRLIKNTFESAYDEDKFVRLINELLSKTEYRGNVYSGSMIPNAYKDFIKSYKYICKYVAPSGEELGVLAVNLAKNSALEKARTAQRNFIANYMKERGKSACLVAFYTDEDNKAHWRFSFVRTDTSFDLETFKLQSTITPAKRYSYMVGDKESSHTAQQQLCQLLESPVKTPELDDIENAFAVEKISNDFFDHYKELFLQLVENIQKIIDKDPRIKFEFVNKNISAELFCKKLMGQIVFLYFIQKKGWLGVAKDAYWGTGDRHFMRTLFETAVNQGKNYFNDFLEPLFYEALASERKSDGYFDKLGCRIPFLNGGLFEPISGYNWQETDIVLDNNIFSNKHEDGILDVFDRYNFTVREDEPLEKEIAVDPEMLGKVFENLLEIKDRKSKGAFYTPREIVHYICQQSLIQYLNTKLEGKVDISDIAFLVRYGDVYSELQDKVVDTKSYESKVPEQLTRIKPYAEQIDNALACVKICDPAVGSGAFPVGMMHEIIRTRQTLLDSGFIKSNKKRTIYEYKRQIIRDSIYGVDIEESAVEIAKLRLWLSLVVDEDNMTNIKPLPNLDYKIVCGDSLTTIEDNILNHALLKELENIKRKYFDSFGSEKANYTKQMKTITNQLFNDEQFDLKMYFSDVFSDYGGFDILIGNPPYGLCQISNTEERVLSYYKTFEVASYKIDLFHLFFERAIKLLNSKGVLGFISPNTYFMNKFIKPLRNFILKNTDIISIVNYEDDVFQDAKVDTATIILSKQKEENHKISIYSSSNLIRLNKITEKNQSDWLNDNNNLFNIKVTENFDLSNTIELGKICNTYFGIQAFDRKSSISKVKLNENYLEIIDGEDVVPFSYALPTKYFNFLEKNIKSGGDFNVYKKERIVIRQIGKFPIVSISKGNILASNTLYSVYTTNDNFSLYYIFAILNSEAIRNYWLSKYSDSKQLFPKIKGYQLKELPIKNITLEEQKPFIDKAYRMLLLNEQLREKMYSFITFLKREYGLEKVSTKLENFFDFEALIKELKIKPSLDSKSKLLELFEKSKDELSIIRDAINKTYEEINTMVYKLYNLNPKENTKMENLSLTDKGAKND